MCNSDEGLVWQYALLCFDANDFCVTVRRSVAAIRLGLCFDANDFCVTVPPRIGSGRTLLCFDANDFCVTVAHEHSLQFDQLCFDANDFCVTVELAQMPFLQGFHNDFCDIKKQDWAALLPPFFVFIRKTPTVLASVASALISFRQIELYHQIAYLSP